MRTASRIVAVTVVLGAFTLPAVPALADAPSTFGQHVQVCAQTDGFTGAHNPGMHQGAAGWDGQTC